MIFYSSVAIVIGVLMIGIGVFNLISKKEGEIVAKKSHLKDSKLYLKISGSLMMAIGASLLISGITSFIVDKDLIFSIIFSVLIFGYLLTDFIVQKKLTIK